MINFKNPYHRNFEQKISLPGIEYHTLLGASGQIPNNIKLIVGLAGIKYHTLLGASDQILNNIKLIVGPAGIEPATKRL